MVATLLPGRPYVGDACNVQGIGGSADPRASLQGTKEALFAKRNWLPPLGAVLSCTKRQAQTLGC